MRENGLEIKEMEKVFKFGRMVQDMMENGLIIKHVEKDHFIMLMVIRILENGVKIELMVMGSTNKIMVLYMKVIGKMIYNMDKEKKNVDKKINFIGADNSSYKGDYFEGKK